MRKITSVFWLMFSLSLLHFVPVSADDASYSIELSRWGIHNDGTHPIETTAGINDAIEWASVNGFRKVHIPSGTYLISATAPSPDNTINLVSNMTLEMQPDTILQKETNGLTGYSVIQIGKGLKNVTVKGGVLIGDRDTHDYHTIPSTHEWGTGIILEGAKNVTIDGVTMKKFPGDGMGTHGKFMNSSGFTSGDFERGTLNALGQPVSSTTKIRTKGRTSKTNFASSVYPQFNNILFRMPSGFDSLFYDLYYFRDNGQLITVDRQVRFYQTSTIPADASYFIGVFEARDISALGNPAFIRETVSMNENVIVKNADIGYNRRQGISIGAINGLTVENCYIHDTMGTAPAGGIDVEPDHTPANNITIRNNRFYNNLLHVILAYGGGNGLIEGNEFGDSPGRGAIGLSAQRGFHAVTIRNNTFHRVGMYMEGPNSTAIGNIHHNGEVGVKGVNNIYRDGQLLGSNLQIGNNEGQSLENVTILQNGTRPGALYVGDYKTTMKNLTITGTLERTSGGLVYGTGHNQNRYTNLKVIDYKKGGNMLTRGVYDNPHFNTGKLIINRSGQYTLNRPVVLSDNNLLHVNSLYGEPEVSIYKAKMQMAGNLGYGGALYIEGAKRFEMLESYVVAPDVTIGPLIKAGPYGYPTTPKVKDFTFVANEIFTRPGSSPLALDTANSGPGSYPFHIEKNVFYNGRMLTKPSDRLHSNMLHRETAPRDYLLFR